MHLFENPETEYNENNKNDIYSAGVVEAFRYLISDQSERQRKYTSLRERAKVLGVITQFDAEFDAIAESFKLWKKPEPFERPFHYTPFPVDALPPAVGDFVRNIADFVQVSADMPAVCALSVLSLCVQGKAVISHMNTAHTESLNLYTAVVAQPAERKSGVYSMLIAPVDDFENRYNDLKKHEINEYKDMKISLETQLSKCRTKGDILEMKNIRKQLENLNPVCPLKLNITDTTAEALADFMAENGEKMGLLSDEGGLFDIIAGRYSGGIPNMDLYLKAYDGSQVSVLRRSGFTKLKKPFLTMGFLVQQDVLSGVFANPAFVGRGFIQRFLFSFPRSKVGERQAIGKPLDKSAQDSYNNLINRLLSADIPDNIPVIHMNKKACLMFENFFEKTEKSLKSGGELSESSALIEWGGKLCGKILRIAGIYHLCEHSADELLDELTMQNAVKTGEYFINHAKQAFFTLETDETTKSAVYIINKLKTLSAETVSKRDLLRLTRKFTADELSPVLELLEEYNYIKVATVLNNNARSTTIININPAVYE